ncbi:MAG: sugar transporter permease [Paenibacillaceae bacterium]|jgi:putative aldouronate transport system permease protein|nr:sugar transporter permease [Paenibacillaceae bacterium]
MAATEAASTGIPHTAEGLHRKRRLKQNIPWMIMFAPIALYFIVFKYVPMLGLVIAFKNYNFYDGILNSPWVGLNNFRTLFSDPLAFSTIRNTLMISVLSILVGFPFPIMIAIMFHEAKQLWFRKISQTLLYLPHFLSWVVVGGMVITLFSQETGPINKLLESWTGETFPFLYSKGSWLAIFLGSGIWKEAGFGAIIYLAALSNIDPSLYEAASMDGAGKLRQIWHITLPGIRSIIVLMMILSMQSVLEVGFDKVYVLQNAIVSDIAEVISTYIFRMGIQGAQFSITTAMGFFESLVGLTLVIIANQIARKFDNGLW